MSSKHYRGDPAPRLSREDIAKKAARYLPQDSAVNLGIGIPALCANYLPKNTSIRYQAENGLLGYQELWPKGEGNPNIMDAGGNFPKAIAGMAFFDSVESFNMIRGGHIDITVLGALQVSKNGDIANWMISSRGIGSIGGAMDLAENTPTVIVTMEHTTTNNEPKIVENCSYPLTSKGCVNLIVTDVAIIEVIYSDTDNIQLLLKETAPGWTKTDIQKITAVELIFQHLPKA